MTEKPIEITPTGDEVIYNEPVKITQDIHPCNYPLCNDCPLNQLPRQRCMSEMRRRGLILTIKGTEASDDRN
jgi:hypothetical protein